MNHQKPIIRRATVADLLTIQMLGTELLQSDLQFGTGLVIKWYHSKEGQKYLLRRIRGRKGLCLVAEIDNQIVGYLTGGILRVQTWRPLKRSEIDNLYVRETQRGTGIGTVLVSEFTRWSKGKGMEIIVLQTYALNKEAIKFYKKQGLVEKVFEMEKDIK